MGTSCTSLNDRWLPVFNVSFFADFLVPLVPRNNTATATFRPLLTLNVDIGACPPVVAGKFFQSILFLLCSPLNFYVFCSVEYSACVSGFPQTHRGSAPGSRWQPGPRPPLLSPRRKFLATPLSWPVF